MRTAGTPNMEKIRQSLSSHLLANSRAGWYLAFTAPRIIWRAPKPQLFQNVWTFFTRCLILGAKRTLVAVLPALASFIAHGAYSVLGVSRQRPGIVTCVDPDNERSTFPWTQPSATMRLSASNWSLLTTICQFALCVPCG